MLTTKQMQLLRDIASILRAGGKEISESNIKDLLMKDYFDFPEDWPSTKAIEDFVSRQKSA